MAHMLLQCTQPEIALIREHAFQTQQTQFDKLHRQRHPHPWFHNALTKLARVAWDPTTHQVERHWTGQLTASQLANAFGCNISTSLLEYQFHKLEQSVTKILLPLYNGGINMLKNRGCRHHNIKVTPMTQPSTLASSQPHRTHTATNPTILQLLQVTSTPRAKPPHDLAPNAGLQSRSGSKRPSPPNETQTRLKLPDPQSPTHTHESRLTCGSGPPETLPKGRPPD